jgi:dihydroorotase
VAVKDGKIAAVAAEISAGDARQALDVRGLLVTPGLVDMHVHVFSTTGVANAWAGDNSIRPDDFSFRTGVTTMADAGSAGWGNFETLRHTVIDRAATKVYAFVNIARLGMMTSAAEQYVPDLNSRETAAIARKHKDVVVGVKAAHWESPEWTQVDRALEAGRLAGIPLMVDFGFFKQERPFYELVGSRLRPGDIATHAYRSCVPWVDESGKLYSYLGEARKRGVVFDVGHGGGSLVFRNAVPAVAQGFYPDTISTDLHTGSMNGAMMDLPTTMAKFLALGMPLRQVIAASTHRPAEVIGHPEHGHLTVGAGADVAAWRLAEGDYGFADASGGTIRGKQRLECELTLRAGRVAWDRNARAGTDYRRLGPTYGVREGEFIVPPPKK